MRDYVRLVWNILKYALTYLIFQVVIGVISSIFIIARYGINSAQKIYNENIFLITLIAAIASILIYSAFLRKGGENLIQRCVFKKISFKSTVLILLCGIGFSALTLEFIQIVSGKFQSYRNVSNTIMMGTNSIIGIACVILLLPMFEEILFRGLIFNELRRRLNVTVSIIIQAIIFGAFHGNIVQGLYAFMLGLALAAVYVWTKSLWSNIIFHVSFNFMGSIGSVLFYYVMSKHMIIYGLISSIIIIASLIAIYKNNKAKPLQQI
ncbi:MAG: caax amino protease family protein [Clostridiaceae bacterium]|jgi:membrane protease YdiL (CAAX protease family)|nr:caax amino protease family protein [Clostridiaceae bacterium]